MQRAERLELRRHIQQSIANDGAVMLCELVSKRGSFYRATGFQCAVNHCGDVLPFIAGTCTDQLVAQLVCKQKDLAANRRFRISIDTGSSEDRWIGSGAGCGGAIEFECRQLDQSDLVQLDLIVGPEICSFPQKRGDFFLPADPRLWIFGGADDAFAVVRQARALGWVVNLVDHRGHDFVKQRCPEADAILSLRPDCSADVRLEPTDHVILMSHSIELDLGWLEFCAQHPPASIGLLGPVQRGERLLQELEQDNRRVLESRLRLRCGTNFQTRSPQHIALAMMMELQQLFEAEAYSVGDSLQKGGQLEVMQRQ